MVNNLVFRWSKPLFFMVLGAHGMYMYAYPHLPFVPYIFGTTGRSLPNILVTGSVVPNI